MFNKFYLILFLFATSTIAAPLSSNTHELIKLQSSVKSQKSRGTCTMFSAIGLVEHLLIKKGAYLPEDIDLSEEWMEYIIMKDKQSEGSSTSRNFKAIKKYGVVHEQTWPYIGRKWVDLIEYPLSRERCSHLEDQALLLQSCLLGHRDPTLLRISTDAVEKIDPAFIAIRDEAMKLKESITNGLFKRKKSYKLKNHNTVKDLLSSGESLIMGTKLYYGSWNSKKTITHEIQERDKKKWYKGIVSYPEPGSRDRRISFEKGGGHSLILVGYDDEVVVNSRMQMEDGSWKKFSYKGVYYFKNSWGVRGFGKRFKLDGISYPGYGMITQKYAHEMGSFFRIK
ncbi:MAG: hypothetical protein BM556_00100 [Bacteriovorax sp. MedPE-SWde]|nr:MAG: hypothetical protein BM556_00100 [Bacteriovorax sp. MedPE-SWde]